MDNDKAQDPEPVRRLLEKCAHRIRLEWLPPYAPELNPQDDIWQHMRRRVTHNHCFGHMHALLDAVNQCNRELEDDSDQVLRLLKKWERLASS